MWWNNTSKYSGEYISNMVKRDFNDAQRKLFDEMSGNTKYFHDPANALNRNNAYPNAYFDTSTEVPNLPFEEKKYLYL